MTMNKDQFNGRVKETDGKIKETAGKLMGNRMLAVKGMLEKTAGKTQAIYGNAKKHMKGSV